MSNLEHQEILLDELLESGEISFDKPTDLTKYPQVAILLVLNGFKIKMMDDIYFNHERYYSKYFTSKDGYLLFFFIPKIRVYCSHEFNVI